MQPNSPKILLFMLLTLLLSGCMNEDTLPQKEEQSVMGRIVLNLSDIDVYVDAQTRATTLSNFDGYVFTLKGKTDKNVDVNDEIPFIASTDEDNKPIAVGYFDAGTYKLTVSNQEASLDKNGCAYYEKTTEESFHFDVGETIKLTIDMGAPQNAKVTLKQEGSFSTLYNNVCVTLTAGGRSVDIGDATDCYSEAFFPAGTLSYSISASAIRNSHVTDITGAEGTITLQAGKAYTITLTASPVTGQIIPLIEGTHNDVFD